MGVRARGVRTAVDVIRCCCAAVGKFSGARGGCRSRLAMIHGRELCAVRAGEMFLLLLHSGGADMLIAIRRHFRFRGTCVEAAASAVEAGAIRFAVVDHRAVVNVVHVVDAAIVEEVAAVPVAALVTEAAVAEAIINSAIEADVRAPETGVPEISAVAPAPISGSPEKSDARRDDPGAGNPEVAVGAVGPVARRPNVAIARAERLFVHRERGRSEGDGDSETECGRGRRRGGGNRHQNEREKQNANDSSVAHDVPLSVHRNQKLYRRRTRLGAEWLAILCAYWVQHRGWAKVAVAKTCRSGGRFTLVRGAGKRSI